MHKTKWHIILAVVFGGILVGGANFLIFGNTKSAYYASTTSPVEASIPNKKSPVASPDHEDTDPPTISMITKELREGKDILRFEIQDDSNIEHVQVKYAKDNEVYTEYLHGRTDNNYKVLIDNAHPSQTVEIAATDYFGNTGFYIHQFNVIPSSNDFLGWASNFYDRLKATMEYRFGSN